MQVPCTVKINHEINTPVVGPPKPKVAQFSAVQDREVIKESDQDRQVHTFPTSFP